MSLTAELRQCVVLAAAYWADSATWQNSHFIKCCNSWGTYVLELLFDFMRFNTTLVIVTINTIALSYLINCCTLFVTLNMLSIDELLALGFWHDSRNWKRVLLMVYRSGDPRAQHRSRLQRSVAAEDCPRQTKFSVNVFGDIPLSVTSGISFALVPVLAAGAAVV